MGPFLFGGGSSAKENQMVLQQGRSSRTRSFNKRKILRRKH